MAKYVTRKIIRRYQEVMEQVNKDLGRTVYLYIKGAPNPAILWDSGSDGPVAPQDWPDETLWWTWAEKRIAAVSIIWGDEMSMFFPGGRFEPDECEITVKLKNVLVDESNTEGETYFDQMEYCIVDGVRCIKKSVVTKMGLGNKAQDLYMCKATVTRKLE